MAQDVRLQPKTAASAFGALSLTLAILALNLRLMISGLAQESQAPSANKIIEVFMLLAVFFWLLSAIRSGKLTLRRSGITIPIIIFTALALISVFQASDLSTSLRFALTLLFHTIFFFVLFHLCLSKKIERVMLSALLASAAVTCVIAFYQYFHVFDVVRESYQKDPALAMVSDQLRPVFEERLSLNEVWATFFLSNTFCIFLTILLPVPLFLLLSHIRKKDLKSGEVATAAFLSIIVLFAIALTGSRGGWLALAASLVLTFLYSRTFGRRKDALQGASFWWAGGIASSLFIFLSLFSPLLLWVRVVVIRVADMLYDTTWVRPHWLQPFLSSIYRYVISTCYRIDYWLGTQEMILKHPFGVGAANFPDNYPYFKLPYGGEVKLPHNSYLGICAEFGIAGLIAFIAIWLTAARRLLKPIPNLLPSETAQDEKPPVSEKYITLLAMAGGVISFVAFSLLGVFYDIPFSTGREILWWAVLWLVFFLLISRRSKMFDSPLLQAALVAGLVSYLLHCLVDFDFSSHGVNITVLTVLAILLARNMRLRGFVEKGYVINRVVLIPAASVFATGIALLCLIYLPGNVAADYLRRNAVQEQMEAFQVLAKQPGQIEEAIAYLTGAAKTLEKAKAASPKDRKVRMELAGVYQYMFNLSRSLPGERRDKNRVKEFLDKAIGNYEEVARLAPLTHTAFYNIALLRSSVSDSLKRSDVEGALEAAKEAQRLYPNKPGYHVLLADLYRWLYINGDEAAKKEMISYYSEALKLSKVTPNPWLKIHQTEVDEIEQILRNQGK